MSKLVEAVALEERVLFCIETLKTLYRTRIIDDKTLSLSKQNKGGTFHLSSKGHEMIGAVAGLLLQGERHWGLPYYRDRAFAIGKGSDLTELMGAFLARTVPNHSSGRMMPEHFSDKRLQIPCQSSCVGSQFLQAVGVAKGVRLQGKEEIVYVSAGDGATSQGDFHEALNFAALHELPLIFAIQDNGWAISVPQSEQTAGGSLEEVIRGYKGLKLFMIDGCNFEEVLDAFQQAILYGVKGPSVIWAKVPRIGPHSNSDDPKKYKSFEAESEDLERDPIPRFEAWLVDQGILTNEEIARLFSETEAEVEAARELAEAMPFPDPKSVSLHLYKESDREESAYATEPKGVGETIVMIDALNHALQEEMARDSGVVVFGQDVAHGKGGVFGVTRGLTQQFGDERCFNTPLAESTIMGLALGLSINGYHKPVAEIQFADYIWTGINQLFNEIATFCYRSNGEWNLPLVIRLPCGGYIQGGPYHSQSIEAFLAHVPGLKIVFPSNAEDAKCLLKAAIRDPNPVIFLEHKALYRQRLFAARPETGKDDLLPLGKAKIVREGADLTVVAWGMTVLMAVEASNAFDDISVEIIDLRTIKPFDKETILASVKKTGKLLVVHEAVKTCGFGAEVVASIVEEAFTYLDAPPVRITALDLPVAYAKVLENETLPQTEELKAAILKLAQY